MQFCSKYIIQEKGTGSKLDCFQNKCSIVFVSRTANVYLFVEGVGCLFWKKTEHHQEEKGALFNQECMGPICSITLKIKSLVWEISFPLSTSNYY